MTIFLNVISKILLSVICVERKQNLQGTYSLNVEQHKKYCPNLKLGLETPLALIILSLPKRHYIWLQRQNIEFNSIINKTVHISNIQEKPPSVY